MEKTTKIKISELSIGDWVRHTFYEENLQIKRIDGESERLLVEKGLMSVSCHLDHFEPIPLTPEILEKNGFERKKYTIDIAEAQEIEYDGYRHILCQDSVQYDIILADSFGGYFDLEIENSCRDDAGERILISSRLSLDYVEYVHQLQHALRLAGVEKEITI